VIQLPCCGPDAEAADEASLRRIQDLLTARLTVAWQDLGG
jgi:hypothetical protein